LGIERETPEAAVVERVHLCAQVDEGCGEQLALLDDSNNAVLLPHEETPIRSEGHATGVNGGRVVTLSVANLDPLKVSAAAGCWNAEEAGDDRDGDRHVPRVRATTRVSALLGIH
jgi:hypothetical protein